MTVKVLVSSIAVCLVLFLIGLLLTYFKIKRDIKEKKKTEQDVEMPPILDPNSEPNALNVCNAEDSGIRTCADTTDFNLDSSGTRSELVQRTISKQMTFELMIASGKNCYF